MALSTEVLTILERCRKIPVLDASDPMPITQFDAGLVELTAELIHAGRSDAGGWNRRQLAAIGIAWKDLTRGWISRHTGRVVTREQYDEFLELRGVTKAKAMEDGLFSLDSEFDRKLRDPNS
jgi:hypothetical protein